MRTGSSAGTADTSTLWRPEIDGVEVLHARFRRHRYARHAHAATTIALMDEGAATFWYRGENFTAPEGSVFFINPETVHTGNPVDAAGYGYRVLYLGADALPRLVPGFRGPLVFPATRTVVQDDELVASLNHTHRVLAVDGQPLRQEEALLRVVTLLVDRYAENVVPVQQRSENGHHAVRRARDYLETHPTKKVSLNDLAQLAATSPYRLVRMFRAEVGLPPHAYQVELRIRLARKLLTDGAAVVDVASEAGFWDQAHMTRTFKRYTGVTPGQFVLGARVAGRPWRGRPVP